MLTIFLPNGVSLNNNTTTTICKMPHIFVLGLGNCATSRKVAGSILDGVIGIFY
jgi:hypothetical protein